MQPDLTFPSQDDPRPPAVPYGRRRLYSVRRVRAHLPAAPLPAAGSQQDQPGCYGRGYTPSGRALRSLRKRSQTDSLPADWLRAAPILRSPPGETGLSAALLVPALPRACWVRVRGRACAPGETLAACRWWMVIACLALAGR
ncbi:PREDICTED: uncharacterized protein LOC105580188 [Cercocebus atys]|uniref:uncharacterized protein LOC105580188 n=1 Tax=Cercocebus atys TaxID=9531 RepID=UPI0005F41785|nr:PREDICTED: uncharacterized protein LOC105580188 [Cercocebus atys]